MSIDMEQQMKSNLTNFMGNIKNQAVTFRDLAGNQFTGTIVVTNPNQKTMLIESNRERKLWKLEEIGSLKFTGSVFKTDAETVQSKVPKQQRSLVKWTDTEGEDINLNQITQAEPFDQFAVNQKLGVQANYDENCYTTELKAVDQYLKEFADKQAQEVLKSKETNIHILEDRNLKPLKDNDDEEADYSAVLGTGGYTQPEQPKKFYNSKTDPKLKAIILKETPVTIIDAIIEEITYPNAKQLQLPFKKIDVTRFNENSINKYLTATEFYKWQTVVPDWSKNKMERQKKELPQVQSTASAVQPTPAAPILNQPTTTTQNKKQNSSSAYNVLSQLDPANIAKESKQQTRKLRQPLNNGQQAQPQFQQSAQPPVQHQQFYQQPFYATQYAQNQYPQTYMPNQYPQHYQPQYQTQSYGQEYSQTYYQQQWYGTQPYDSYHYAQQGYSLPTQLPDQK